MSEARSRSALEALLDQTAKAHHQAFIATDGKDPDWALWYADHLADEIGRLLDRTFTRSELTVTLADAANEHEARGAEQPWASFYADFFCERYDCEQSEALALYHLEGCPFCIRVIRVIDELGIDVELRDIWADETHRRDLMEARGRTTVPVLRCTSKTRDRWMPESADIVRYLRDRFG